MAHPPMMMAESLLSSRSSKELISTLWQQDMLMRFGSGNGAGIGINGSITSQCKIYIVIVVDQAFLRDSDPKSNYELHPQFLPPDPKHKISNRMAVAVTEDVMEDIPFKEEDPEDLFS